MLKYCLKCKGWCRYDQFFQSYVCACSIERYEEESEEGALEEELELLDEEELSDEEELELSDEVVQDLKLLIKEYEEKKINKENEK